MKENNTVDCGCAVFCELGVFSKAELELHGKETHDLIKILPQLREELRDGFKFTYEGDESLFLRLAQWTSREHQCCAWANFRLEIEPFEKSQSHKGGKIVLTVYGGGEAGKQVLSQGFNDLVQHK